MAQKLGPGTDSKGNKGTWKKNAAGKLIFVAAKSANSAGSVLSVDRFSKWDPEHQRQALKFHGGNVTPEDFLKMSPAQKRDVLARVRSGSKAAASPDSTSRPQSLTDIYKGAEDAAAVKYGDAERGLKSDIDSSPVQEKRVDDWFDQWRKMLSDINANTNTQYDAAVKNATDLKTATAGAAATDDKARLDAAAADAAARGATVDPNVKAQADAAAANRSSAIDAIAGVIGGQRANAINFQGQQKGITGNQQLVEHTRERNRLSDLKTKLRGLLTEKGAFEGATRQDLLSNERKNQLEQATLQGQILNTTLDAQNQAATREQTAKDKAAQRSDSRKGRYGAGSPVLNKYGLTADEWSKLPEKEKDKYRSGKKKPGKKTKPSVGPGSISPAKESELVSKVNSYLSQFKTPPNTWIDQADRTKGQRRMTKDEVYHGLLAAGADERVVQLADSLYRNKGRLGPNGIKQAHALGIHVNKRWSLTPKPKKARNSPNERAPGGT